VHRRSRYLAAAIALIAALAFADGVAARRETSVPAAAIRALETYRLATWHRQHVMGLPATRVAERQGPIRNAHYRRWLLQLWERRANAVFLRAQRVPHRNAWLCIHRYEASWTAATGNGYYGGLQMNISFMRHYGPYLLRRKGTANRWTPLEQMWVAERALESGRGFYPWPHTARVCGLI
jgi:hypothetical protein